MRGATAFVDILVYLLNHSFLIGQEDFREAGDGVFLQILLCDCEVGRVGRFGECGLCFDECGDDALVAQDVCHGRMDLRGFRDGEGRPKSGCFFGVGHVVHLQGFWGLYQGQFVESFPNVVSLSFVDECLLSIRQEEVVKMAVSAARFFALCWKFARCFVGIRKADFLHGASVARRGGGRAERCSEVHHGLVEEGRTLRVDETLRQLLKFVFALCRVDRSGDFEGARQDAVAVAVHRGVGQSEGERADGRRRVVADTFERENLFVVVGELAVVLFDDALCGKMEIPGAAVIAQPLPAFQHLLFVGFGQRFHVRKVLDEVVVVVDSLRHARLLEDDFRNPDFVGVVRFPPGEFPFVLLVPIDE